jgi:hypothetical protein
MNVTPVTPSAAATTAAASATPAATGTPVAKVPAHLTAANVSAAVLQAAVGDGDGRTGAAALNDGDAASQAARRSVDVKA